MKKSNYISPEVEIVDFKVEQVFESMRVGVSGPSDYTTLHPSLTQGTETYGDVSFTTHSYAPEPTGNE